MHSTEAINDGPGHRIRVLVVDDSAFARSVISRQLSADPEIEVVGHAADGIEALEQIKSLRPDVVTLDISMPRMDGIETLEHIVRDIPTPTVMVSVLTSDGASITLEALDKGAVDFVLKPVRAGVPTLQELSSVLCTKVKLAATARLPIPRPRKDRAVLRAPRKVSWKDTVVVIGSSTGGPQALTAVLQALPADTKVPILVVQHMPKEFTGPLAERLNLQSKVRVVEGSAGMRLEPGLAIVAPGGHHMVLNKRHQIQIDDRPPECGVRPSINVTMESVVAVYGRSTLGVILTGMGSDGTRGAGLIKGAGGNVIAESPETCVIYGMPRSVVEAGYADGVIPLESIAGEIVSRCSAPMSVRATK